MGNAADSPRAEKGSYVMQSPLSSRPENRYFIDVESSAELARLMDQDRLINRYMQHWIMREDTTGIHDILDIACGPGGWVLDVAATNRQAQVTGIEISEPMVDYACAQATMRGLKNAHFKVMNALETLAFPDNSFDLINMRLIFGFMPPSAWPALMQECRRLLRPGGIIQLTESEMPITNSPSFELLASKSLQAMVAAKKSFSPDGRHNGITTMLSPFLRRAGFRSVHLRAFDIDYSAGTDIHEAILENWMIAFKLLKPFLVGTRAFTAEEYDRLYNTMLTEMLLDTFRAIWFFVTAWGEKA